MELTVQNVYGLLLRSRLLSLDEAKAMFARWQAESRDGSSNLARFAAWMVSHKYVTEYQAGLLARGHAEGFFLGEYKILDRLGKGRMAGVYKAQHQLGQVVAIKVLPPSKAREPQFVARFHREARLALRLKHPNVVRSFQTGQANGLHYLVMEYLDGETVEDVLVRRKKLPPAEAVRLVYQALQGLQHFHEQGLVHRDLKPSNLMLVGGQPNSTQQATVKILDIGLGRSLFEDGSAERAEDSGVTGEGVLLGTPDYMSPEQARDPRTADIRSDVYSLGCVLYHLLAGQPPFPDTNVISQMIRHATEAARPLKDFNPAVPDGLQQIINWMMAKDPAGRYPTPERAAQALQVFLAAGSSPAVSLEADPRMRTYLTWLEVEGKKPPAPAAAAPAKTLPAAAPAAKAARPERAPAQAERQRSSGKRRSRKGRRNAVAPPPLPPTAVPVEKEPVINVELVPFPEAAAGPRGLRLGRRDFVFFGLGAAAGALATFLGCLVALAGKKNRPAEGDAEKKEK